MASTSKDALFLHDLTSEPRDRKVFRHNTDLPKFGGAVSDQRLLIPDNDPVFGHENHGCTDAQNEKPSVSRNTELVFEHDTAIIQRRHSSAQRLIVKQSRPTRLSVSRQGSKMTQDFSPVVKPFAQDGEKLDEFITRHKSSVDSNELRDVIAFTKDELQSYREQAATHVHTRVFDKALSIVKDLNYAVLTGSMGVGKTYTAMYLLDHMISSNPDMNPVIIRSVAEFNRVVDVAENLVVLIDDFGGSLAADDTSLTDWNQGANILSSYLKDRKIFLILTAHSEVIQRIKSKYSILGCIICPEASVYFDDVENLLTEIEKTDLCLKYAKFQDIPLDRKSAALLDSGINMRIGFPLLCKLMTRSNFRQLFEDPVKAIDEQVNVISTDAKSHFIVLLLTLLFDGILPSELNENQNDCYDRVLTFVKIRKNYRKITDTANGLVGTVLKYDKQTNEHSFVHPGLLQVMLRWLWKQQRGVFIELCPIKYFNYLIIETNNSCSETEPDKFLQIDQMYFNDVLDRIRHEMKGSDDSDSENPSERTETASEIAALNFWEYSDFVRDALQYLGFQFFVSEYQSCGSLFSCLAKFGKEVAVSCICKHMTSSEQTIISDAVFQKGIALACRFGQLSVFNCLFQHCDQLSDDIIMAAAEGGNVEIMELIATKVLNFNIETQDKISAVHLACRNGHKELVKYLHQRIDDSILLKDSKGRSILHYAVISGNKDIVKFLISNTGTYDPDLLIRTRTGTTLLHTACEHGWPAIVKYLCKMYPSMILSVDEDGLLPVDCAVVYGHVDCLEYLLNRKEKSDEVYLSTHSKDQVKAGRTVLHLACLTGRLNMVKYLCRTFPDMINSENNDSLLPIHDALMGGNTDVLDHFIENVHGPSILTSDGRTLLHIAAFNGKLQVVKHICCKYPSLLKIRDLDGNTAGHDASASGSIEVLNILVQHGIDPKDKNQDGCSLLHDAAYFGRLEMVKYLCEKYREISEICSNTGYSVAHAAALGGSVNVLKYLINTYGEQNTVSQDNSTLLHEAAFSGQIKMVQFLCSLYPDTIKSRTKNSFTPCHYAVQEGNEDVAVFLLGKMSDPFVLTDDRETFLHIAAYNGQLNMVKYFTNSFPELIDMTDTSGATVLHAAARGGHVETMIYLLELGLDPGILTENGSTLLHLAAYNGRIDMVKFLCDKLPGLTYLMDGTRHSAAHYAAGSGNVEVFKYLVSKGIDPMAQTDNGSSCLLKAAYTGALDMIVYLVESFPGLLELRDQYDCTAAHYTACEGHIDVLKYLISKGLNPFSSTVDGHTVLHISAFHGRYEVVVFLCTEYSDLIPMEDMAGKTVWTFAENGGHENILEFLRKIKKISRQKMGLIPSRSVTNTCHDFWLTLCTQLQKLLCFCRNK